MSQVRIEMLGSLCTQVRGIAYGKDEIHESSVEDTVPLLRATNILETGELDLDNVLHVNGNRVSQKQLLEKGDVLISASTGSKSAIGKPARVRTNGEVTFGAFCKALRPNTKVVDADYFWFLFCRPEYRSHISNVVGGANINNIRNEHIDEMLVPLPPLETQKHIARVLEQADQLRKQAQQMESELSQLAQSLFLEMFGDYRNQPEDRFVPLSNVADVVSGVAKGSDLKGKQSRIVPYLRVANVQDGFLDLSEVKEIEATERDIEKYVLKPGDILMTEGGDYDKLGRGAMWSGEVEGCIHQNHIFRVRLSEAYEPKFFEYYLRSTMVKTYFLRCAKKTTNLASINMTQLKALLTPKEGKKNQEKFVCALEHIEKQIQTVRTKGEHLEQTFQALMQQAFKGKLTTQGTKAA